MSLGMHPALTYSLSHAAMRAGSRSAIYLGTPCTPGLNKHRQSMQAALLLYMRHITSADPRCWPTHSGWAALSYMLTSVARMKT